jgi:hypothetical protein
VTLLLLLEPSLYIRLGKAQSHGHIKTWQTAALRKSKDRLLGYVEKQGQVMKLERLRSLF